MSGLFPESRLAVAIDRFDSAVPTTYRAATMPNAPQRVTRGQAETDERAWLAYVDECSRRNP